MNQIFIQIASYRDNQLLPTIRDCIANARHPENLRFCIAWQHNVDDKWDNVDDFSNDPRFIIIDIDYLDSEGACWARNLIQQHYGGEQYTLQLDSHHRFIPNWDVELISMIKTLQKNGHEKPIITSYLPAFDPVSGEKTMFPYKLDFDRFIPEGPIFFMPSKIENFESLTCPIRSRFYSAHFCFTLGSFCIDVQHDPNMYFHGEEISISVRAYTHGYDLFSPHKVIAWHEYTRNYRKKHWDDHTNWGGRNKQSHLRLKMLLGIDGITDRFRSQNQNQNRFGKYGLGNIRSLFDYEQYAGICFKTRSVQQYTLDNGLPPNPTDQPFVSVFKHCIDIHSSSLPHNDYKFVAVIFEDNDGNQLFRQDIDGRDLGGTLDTHDKFYKIWRTFTYTVRPSRYIVWPYSEKHGWCDKIRHSFD